ncbi:S9 family peptidase [Flavobacterium zepuense]|uniref:S9 family peptidase n=1 Tax=Flavobacterium zepuense TaxID=2593302 RepID=A0A552V610_9FLAO|nr:S9 family peptidase [Flavobacterium zepuense]TRW25891.1 S9 family peptidase [Flavobacterium zepuense]
MQKLIIALILLINIFSASMFAQKKFELSDTGKFVNIGEPKISPDGKSIVIVVSRPDYEQNRYNYELVLVDIATGKQRILTQDRIVVAYPRWSPDGSKLAFIAKVSAAKDALAQIFIIPMNGGDAKQITKAPKSVQHFAWSPTSDEIAYATADEQKRKKEIEKGYTDFEIGNNDVFVNSQPTPTHIWLVNTLTFEQKRLTEGDWSLPVTIMPGPPSSPFSWSPDGKSILFTKVATAYSGDLIERTVNSVTVADKAIKQITPRTTLESYPNFSPDGSKISYWYKNSGRQESSYELWVTNTGSGTEGKVITDKLDRDVYCSVWMPDGKSFLVGAHNDNKTSLWTVTLDGKATQLDLGTICPNWSFWVDASVSKSGSIAFIGSNPTKPAELYYLKSATAKPIQLTNFNKEIAAMTLGKTETIRWGNDGLKHCGIVTYPANYEKGKKYPLVLLVHGGPNAASVEMFARFPQLLANQGYFTFEPNYRGSDNLGSAYKLAITENAGTGPGRDVMAGLEKLKATGIIDTDNIAVTGWSYGGFMTVWLAGHYGGWKCAVAGAAVTDWVDQYSFSDGNVARSGSLGGSPFVGDNMKKYIEQSPITEAHNIKAPTLILSNTADPRVPITQSYKLYHVLKDNGVVTKFIGWPVAAHNASDPVTLLERDKYWIDWLNTYLK